MARITCFVLVLVFGASTTCAFSGHNGGHDKLALPHASFNLTERAVAMQKDWKLHKRFDNARCTNYKAGLGACGATNSDSDFIVALNAPQFGNGEHCFQTITINYSGKSTRAQITDRCAECPYGAIDLTNGLFSYFANLDDGVFYASWDFGSGDSPSTTTSSTTPPAPTTAQQEKTSSTWTPETTSWSSGSTWGTSSSSSWSSGSSSSSSSSSAAPSSTRSSASSSSTSSSTTQVVNTTSVLELLNYGVVQLGGLIEVAAQVNLDTSDTA